MNTLAHWISGWTAFWLLSTGLSGWLPGDPFLPASWTTIFGWLPDWLDWIWPGLYTVAGVLAVGGLKSTRLLILSYYAGALAYFIWGSTSMYGWVADHGGTIPGSAGFYVAAGLLFQAARSVGRNRHIEQQIATVQTDQEADRP